jgi:poly(beta-D-mannuronate) lyase
MRKVLKAIVSYLLLMATPLVTSLAHAATTQVGSIAALQAALDGANPGDTIVLKNGTYADGNVTLARSGTAEAPITVQAETPGSVTLSRSSFGIEGNYWIVEGVHIVDGINVTTDVLYPNQGVFAISGSYNVVRNVKFSGANGISYAVVNVSTGHNNLIAQNTIETLTGSLHVFNVLNGDNNVFRDNRILNAQGGGVILYNGNGGKTSNNTQFLHNYVAGVRNSPSGELMSLKSGYVVLKNNYFTDNTDGILMLRWGNDQTVSCNMFINTAGWLLTAANQTITNNYFETAISPGQYAIALAYGDPPPAVLEISGTINTFKDSLIQNNTIANWDGGAIGLDNRKPDVVSGVRFDRNLIYSPNISRYKAIFDTWTGAPGNCINCTWTSNIVVSPNSGNLSSGISTQDPNMQRGADGILRSTAFPQAGFQPSQCNIPRNPNDVGASWTGGPSAPVLAPPKQLREVELR